MLQVRPQILALTTVILISITSGCSTQSSLHQRWGRQLADAFATNLTKEDISLMLGSDPYGSGWILTEFKGGCILPSFELFGKEEEVISKVEVCTKCGSVHIVKNGKRPNGQQKFHCNDCGSWGTLNPIVPYSEERKEEILRAYAERSSMRGIQRTFGVHRNTLSVWLKKSQKSS